MATRLNEQLYSYSTIDELFPKIEIVDSTSYLLIDNTDFGKSTAPVSARVTKSIITDFQAAQQDIITLQNKVDGLTNAYVYKGVVNADSDLPYNSAVVGWSYKVATPGVYAGQQCEIGDTLICQTAGSESTPATWNILQTNIDGAVVGPASAAEGAIAVFNGATGKIIKAASTTGSTSKPVYINNSGIPVQCGYDFTDYLPLSGGTITGDLVINGSLTTNNTTIDLDKDTNIGGNLTVNGNTTITGTLHVNGDITTDGNITADEGHFNEVYLNEYNYWNTTEGLHITNGLYLTNNGSSYGEGYVPTTNGGVIQPALKTDLNNYLPLSGGTVTGNVTISGNLVLTDGSTTITLNAALLSKLKDLMDKLDSGYDLVMVQKP